MNNIKDIINSLNDSLKNLHVAFIDGVGDVYAVSEETIKKILVLLKEHEAKTIMNKWHKNPLGDYSRLHCPWCDRELDMQSAKEYVACPYCGRKVKWNEQPRTSN